MFRILSETPWIWRSGSTTERHKRFARALPWPVSAAAKISTRHIPHEQEQMICGLVEVAVAQIMSGQRAGGEHPRLATGIGGLAVAALVKVPVAGQLRAWAGLSQPDAYVFSADGAMLFNISPGDTVGDALVADGVCQPPKYRGIVTAADRLGEAMFLEGGPGVLDQIFLTGNLTDTMDDPCRECQAVM
jgi:hypothetical protein